MDCTQYGNRFLGGDCKFFWSRRLSWRERLLYFKLSVVYRDYSKKVLMTETYIRYCKLTDMVALREF